MALFSRRKNQSAQDAETQQPVDETTASETVAQEAVEVTEAAPQVGISLSSYGGVGVPSAPNANLSFGDEPEQEPAPVADAPVPLPFAPDEPPTEWESVAGMRDNAVLRDALARLSADASVPELLGVARQLLQGHLFLRVKGDAREQVAKGEPLALGVVNDNGRNFLLAFSSGAAVYAAINADNDRDTSAIGQPAGQVLQHVLDSDFAGLILDQASAPARAVIPRDLIERAMGQAQANFTVKAHLAAERTPETVNNVVAALGELPMWVGLGKAGEVDGKPQFGVAEVRTQSGARYLQLFTHPLEVIALGREEQQPAPFTAEQLRGALAEIHGLSGVLIDSAGPSLRIEMADLQPLLLAE